MHFLGLQNTFPKIKNVNKPFTVSKFSYCTIVWMCHGSGLNNKMNNIHERALRIKDKKDKKNPVSKR